MVGPNQVAELQEPDPLAEQWDEQRPPWRPTRWRTAVTVPGRFTRSLELVLYRSGYWLDRFRAVWNKGSHGVREAVHQIEAKLPFSILGFDCDNGSEFPKSSPVALLCPAHRAGAVHPLAAVSQERQCARGAKELDACALSGYDRLENQELLGPINTLYRDVWALYHNHFCPSTKLVEKRREGRAPDRRYDAPKTPYQRLLQSDVLEKKERAALQQQHAAIESLCAQATD